jgi:hypothetical protein
VRLDITPDGPANHWAAVKVRTCWTKKIAGNADNKITVTWAPWSLVDSENGRWSAFESGFTPDKWLTPTYPMDEEDGVLRMGECVVGWMEFPVDNGVKITHVRRTVENEDPVTWKV